MTARPTLAHIAAQAGPAGQDGIAAGTRIDTPRGEVPVETLREGNAVLIEGGGIGVIKWIGQHQAQSAIVIAPQAWSDREPRRPLRLAPDQAILFAGPALIPAGLLVNGHTIRAHDTPSGTQFYQLALRDGACLLAEGLALRAANAPADVVAEPGDRRPAVIERGPTLAHATQHADRRAGLGSRPLRGAMEAIENHALTGWAVDRADPSHPVTLELLLDGAVIATAPANLALPGLHLRAPTPACGFRLALPPGITGIHDIAIRRTGDGLLLFAANTLLAVPQAPQPDATATHIAALVEAIDRLRPLAEEP